MEISGSTSIPPGFPGPGRQPRLAIPSSPCRRQARRCFAITIAALASLAFTPEILNAQGPASVDITEYGGDLEVAQSITAGPDGAVWFTQRTAGKISRTSMSGAITEFALPNAGVQPCVITAGPDGALWFTEVLANRIGRMATNGSLTEYPIPSANTSPQGITLGPDGALWFTEAAGRIGRITTAGEISEFTLPGGHDPTSITTGPDGAVWFAEYSKIGRARLPKARTGVLSHIAAGGSWTSTITLINTATVPVPLTVAFRDGGGNALTLPVTVSQGGAVQGPSPASSVDATLQPKATLMLSMGENLAGLEVGWAEVLGAGPVCGYAIFRTVAAGQASEGTVPLQTQLPPAMALPFENTGGFTMGVAMANLSAAPATVTATVWDEAGTLVGTATLDPIPANGYTSFVLGGRIGLTVGRRGMVRFESSEAGGLAGLGLRSMDAQNTFTSVPTI